jgi:hypothetical protein
MPLGGFPLAGARTVEREADLRRLLARCQLFAFETVIDVEAESRIYRGCRRAGVTPRV